MKKLSIEDIDFEFIPASVLQDVDNRIADWRAAGGKITTNMYSSNLDI